MKRYHSVKDRSKRVQRKKLVKRMGYDYLLEGNNMRNRHPLDCGRKQCHVCHFDKLYGYKKARDYRELERFDNMVYEQFDHNHDRDDELLWLANFED
jgi:hypothetical protein